MYIYQETELVKIEDIEVGDHLLVTTEISDIIDTRYGVYADKAEYRGVWWYYTSNGMALFTSDSDCPQTIRRLTGLSKALASKDKTKLYYLIDDEDTSSTAVLVFDPIRGEWGADNMDTDDLNGGTVDKIRKYLNLDEVDAVFMVDELGKLVEYNQMNPPLTAERLFEQGSILKDKTNPHVLYAHDDKTDEVCKYTLIESFNRKVSFHRQVIGVADVPKDAEPVDITVNEFFKRSPELTEYLINTKTKNVFRFNANSGDRSYTIIDGNHTWSTSDLRNLYKMKLNNEIAVL